jgi:hypothetical protein
VGGSRGCLDAWNAGVALACLSGFFERVMPDRDAWGGGAGAYQGIERISGTLGHPNLLGAVAAATAPMALARAFEDRPRRWLHAALALIAGLATILTFSRGAWLGLLVGLFTCMVLLVRRGEEPRTGRRVIMTGLVVLLVLGVVAAVAGWGGPLLARFRELLVPTQGAGGSRLEIWRAALAAWRNRPILGQGPDTLELLFRQFQTPDSWKLEWGLIAFQAHSIYLNALATRGALGFAAGGLVLAALLRAAIPAAVRDRGTRIALAGPIGGLAALAVSGAFNAIGIGGALCVVLIVATIATRSAEPAAAAGHPPRPPLRRAPVAARRGDRGRAVSAVLTGTAVALVVLGGSINEFVMSRDVSQAELWLQQPRTHWDRDVLLRYAIEADRCERAQRRVPYHDRAPHVLGLTLLQWSSGWPERDSLVAGAVSAFREAIRRVPLRALNYRRLGGALAARVALGDTTARGPSEVAFARAAELAPQDAFVLVDWAHARLASGHPHEAIEPARRAASLYPGSALALLTLAQALHGVGDDAGARAALARASDGSWYGDPDGPARIEALSRALGPEHGE